MRPLTIQLDDQKYETLAALARKKGLADVEKLVNEQLDAFIAHQGTGNITPGLQEHLRASIEENRHLLERLAQ